MKEFKEIRDQDGFICLLPKKSLNRHGPSLFPTYKNGVGDHWLIKNEFEIPDGSSIAYRVSVKPTYTVEYQPKTWQRKAWELISPAIKWNQKSDFHNLHGSKKLRHLKCVAVALKVRCVGGSHKPVLDTIANRDSPYKIYCVATSIRDLKLLMNRWYDMLFQQVYTYLDKAVAVGYEEIAYVSKVMLVYDDYSYESWMGYPTKLAEHLGLKFDNKGKVILNER